MPRRCGNSGIVKDYGSAAELAADIRRHLHHEPIVARPPSAMYQLSKFARRNRALVTGVAAVFAVLVLGIVASAWEAVQARHAAKRAEQESTAMTTILEDQKKRVAETAKKYSDSQLLLDFSDDENRQLESNKRHWDKRLHAIDQELATEPDRIRSIYEVKAQRIEPIGLVYLWPVTG